MKTKIITCLILIETVLVAWAGGTAVTPQAAHLVVVLDGGLAPDALERAKAYAARTVERLADRDVLTVVACDAHVHTLASAESATNRVALVRRMNAWRPEGESALFAALAAGGAALRADAGREKRLLVLSDMKPTVGPANGTTLRALLDGFRKEGVRVSGLRRTP